MSFRRSFRRRAHPSIADVIDVRACHYFSRRSGDRHNRGRTARTGGGGTAPPAPALAITSPAPSARLYTGQQYTLTYTCLGVTSVEFFWDAVSIGTSTPSGTTGTLSWTPTLAQTLLGGTLSAVGATGAAPVNATPLTIDVWSPLALSGLVLWSDPTNTTDGGNGTQVTQFTDRSATGANLTPYLAGTGPTRRDLNGRVPRHAEIFNARTAATTNATIVGLANGAASDKTIVHVWQDFSSSTTFVGYSWSWGHTTTINNYITKRVADDSWTDSFIVRDSGNNLTRTFGLNHTGVQLSITRFNAGAAQIDYRVDGVNETTQSLTQASKSINVFGLGLHLNGSSYNDTSHERLYNFLLFNRRLSDAECQEIETWQAPALGPLGQHWKGGYAGSADFGPGSGEWLVVALLGQSNMVGSNSAVYAGDGTTQGLYVLYQDGFLDVCQEPTFDATNAMWEQATGTSTSCARRLGELLRAAGEARNILFVPCAVGGTSSAQWATNITQDPPRFNGPATAPIGFTKHWIDEALKAPNAELVFVVYQGESDAENADNPALWSPNWATIQDNLNTRYAAYLTRTKPWFFVQLPATAPASGFSNWATLRANQATHCNTTRGDSTLVTYSGETYADSPTNLHIDDTTQVTRLAPALATAIWNGT